MTYNTNTLDTSKLHPVVKAAMGRMTWAFLEHLGKGRSLRAAYARELVQARDETVAEAQQARQDFDEACNRLGVSSESKAHSWNVRTGEHEHQINFVRKGGRWISKNGRITPLEQKYLDRLHVSAVALWKESNGPGPVFFNHQSFRVDAQAKWEDYVEEIEQQEANEEAAWDEYEGR